MGIVYKEGARYKQNKMTIFSARTMASVSIFIFGTLILLRKKRLPFNRDKYQFNAVTLKQTLGIVLIVYLMNALEYWIKIDKYLELSILSAVSLLVPFLLMITTRQSYPALWSEFDKSNSRNRFFMTRNTVRPRSSCHCESSLENKKKFKFSYV